MISCFGICRFCQRWKCSMWQLAFLFIGIKVNKICSRVGRTFKWSVGIQRKTGCSDKSYHPSQVQGSCHIRSHCRLNLLFLIVCWCLLGTLSQPQPNLVIHCSRHSIFHSAWVEILVDKVLVFSIALFIQTESAAFDIGFPGVALSGNQRVSAHIQFKQFNFQCIGSETQFVRFHLFFRTMLKCP